MALFRGKIALILVVIISLMTIQLPVMAEPEPSEAAAPLPADDEQAMQLLEKSLSIVEIDKEIARIQENKQALKTDMDRTNSQLEQQELLIIDKREAAGNVLRAYYMGERDFMYSALFSFRQSLSSWFAVLDYIEIIMSSDRDAINQYVDGYRSLQNNYDKLNAKKDELEAVEQRLHEQRERVLALENQIDDELAGRSDAEKLRLMMSELTEYWETVGIEEVENYFRALAAAMEELPGWIQDNKNYLDIDGLNYTLHIPQDALNAFLREQDKRFEQFSFVFNDGKVTAQGKTANMEISVTGHYTVENEPKNGILFHVDELLFNGFALPDTTRQSLEQQFDLGFYPGKIVSFLKADSVEITDGELTVKLKVKL
ncbi:hypothetical protein [Paenibacillus sp. NEAU-GSW1]|uniref:coiled-coil domain-containing protein n=1 Tax=Paenibacillus sp. NEAU-GSW1 TaxID=2682486 RepID=UPI0012E15A9B|nr:hypothetical protein [Paenibacillus sp. NEAU-GSW1]MUT66211.1 hypothetical protein [Paenibacillus sp. NEAU-GSW1]